MNHHIGDTNKMIDTPRTDAAYTASTGAGIYELFKESQDIERELNAANDRIKRLEEAGNEMHRYITVTRGLLPECTNIWRKAKEDKL